MAIIYILIVGEKNDYTSIMNYVRKVLSGQMCRYSRQLSCTSIQQLRIANRLKCYDWSFFSTRLYAAIPKGRGPLLVVDETEVDSSKYSNILIKLDGYDSAVLTSYYHFVDQAARNMNFKVPKKFNLKTEDVRVTLANPPHFYREKNMQYNFKSHGRMIQIESIPSEKADIFVQYIQTHIPAGVSVDIELKKWEDFVSPPSERNIPGETGWQHHENKSKIYLAGKK